MVDAQVAHGAREDALHGTHGLERNVRNDVSKTARTPPQFFANERSEVDPLDNKLNAFNLLVKTCTRLRKKTHVPSLFIPYQYDKAYE